MGKGIGGLPYFEIPVGPKKLKFLIDCGSNSHMISPECVSLFKIKPYKIPPENIKGINGISTVTQMINLPLFCPIFKESLSFVVMKFHPFFDGIIGTQFLLNPKIKLLLHEKKLSILRDDRKFSIIPLLFYQPEKPVRRSMLGSLDSSSLSEKIRTDHLTEFEREELLKTLNGIPTVFHDPDKKLSCTTVVQCDINTTDDLPVYQKSYPYPAAYREEVDKQIEKYLADGIIRPSRSEFNSPIWIVPKKQDASEKKKFRLVVDFRKLNEKTISDRYPMPEISTILDQLKGNAYFTTLDLASGFHQIKMREKDAKKTAFSVNNGKYEFVRMPFGLRNAPSIFQRAMDDVLRKHIGKRCYVYMDDVVVFGRTLEESLTNIRLVLETLNEANLKVQLDKSEFLKQSVEFLGYIITREGVSPNEKKIQAILQWPVPKNLKQLRGFLGLIGYYRRFIKNFAKIAKPLTSAMRGAPTSNAPINLDKTQIECYESLKKILTSNDILAYPDFTKHFIITTDASNFAIGAVLSQNDSGKDRPIYFASRTLNKTEENYSASEKEMLAIIWALKVFRNYIYGQKFQILTDHQPLTFTLSPNNTNAKLKRWKSYLEEHDYEILYKPGKSNVVADALSRIEFNAASSSQQSTEDNDTQHSAEDDDTNYIPSTEAPLNVFRNQVVLQLGEQGSEEHLTPFQGYHRVTVYRRVFDEATIVDVIKKFFDPSKINGLSCSTDIIAAAQEVYRKYFSQAAILKIRFTQKILIDVTDPSEQTKLIQEVHERAHRGITENKMQIMETSYFPSLTAKIKEFIRVCDICNISKYDRKPLEVKLQNTPIPKLPYDILQIDIYQIEKEFFLSMLDKFSKYGRMVPIESRQTCHVEEAFWNAVTSFLVPKLIVMDNEGAFNSPEIKGRLLDLGVQIYYVPPNHTESNGIVERFHSTITEIYRIQKNMHPLWNVKDLVRTSVEKYNCTIHSVLKMSPRDVLLGKSSSQALSPEELEAIRTKTYDEIIVRLLEAQKKQNGTNARRDPPDLVADQIVYTKDKVIKAKHKNRFKKTRVRTNNRVTFEDSEGRKKHKQNIKNIGLSH